MKMNRVQFQPGLSMAEFIDQYGSDEKCEAALIESRWPSGFACPACGCSQSGSIRREGRRPRRPIVPRTHAQKDRFDRPMPKTVEGADRP